MKQNKEQLIKYACLGYAHALNQLLLVCQPDIRRFARRICSTTEDVEDAVQFTLWQLHKKIGTLKTISSFTSWLFRIIERECYRLFKVRQSKNIEARADIDKLSASSADIDLKIDLTNAIISLPLIYRQVLILRDIQRYSTPEVAEKLGITVEAVKSRLHRARLMVKDKINL